MYEKKATTNNKALCMQVHCILCVICMLTPLWVIKDWYTCQMAIILEIIECEYA